MAVFYKFGTAHAFMA